MLAFPGDFHSADIADVATRRSPTPGGGELDTTTGSTSVARAVAALRVCHSAVSLEIATRNFPAVGQVAVEISIVPLAHSNAFVENDTTGSFTTHKHDNKLHL
jgi:hypothetical protein